MDQQKNHYVPQFILKRFGEKINVYNLKSTVLDMRKQPGKVFYVKGLYEDELETLFNRNAESKVHNLLFNKILDEENEVTLTRREILLIKKFLAIEQLRVPDTQSYIKHEREHFKGLSKDYLDKSDYHDNATSNLSDEEYLSLTLKNILEYDGFSEEDFDKWLKNPKATLSAQKWMRLYNSCYISFWDSKKSGEDFIITDEGMSCEHDPSKFLNPTQMELLKPGFMMSLLENPNISNEQKMVIMQSIYNGSQVRANFYFFSLTSTRTIVLIDPFFKTYDKEDPWSAYYHLPSPDFWPSGFGDRTLVEKNKCVYEDIEKVKNHIFSVNDKYIYKIHDMKLEDVLYYNCLMLDRVNEILGFSESQKIIRSLACYLQLGKPRNDYKNLKNQLEDIGYNIPVSQKYKDLAYGFSENPVNEAFKAKKYFDFSLNLAQNFNPNK